MSVADYWAARSNRSSSMPHSDPKAYAETHEETHYEDKVAVIFGCWSSASTKRSACRSSNADNALLFYPSQYEGEESSRKHLLYRRDAAPSRRFPAVNFLRGQGIRRFFLVGTDYIYPRTNQCGPQGLSGEPGCEWM